jgi:hypothetical protein
MLDLRRWFERGGVVTECGDGERDPISSCCRPHAFSDPIDPALVVPPDEAELEARDELQDLIVPFVFSLNTIISGPLLHNLSVRETGSDVRTLAPCRFNVSTLCRCAEAERRSSSPCRRCLMRGRTYHAIARRMRRRRTPRAMAELRSIGESL